MASMPAVWTSPGGSSPVRRSTPRTSTPTVCGAACTKRAKTALRNGAAPRTAPVASPLLLETRAGRVLQTGREPRNHDAVHRVCPPLAPVGPGLLRATPVERTHVEPGRPLITVWLEVSEPIFPGL